MKVFLAMSSSFNLEAGPIPIWREMQEADKFKQHVIVDDPADADIILFTDLHLHQDAELRSLRKHHLWKQYAHKILVYDERDRATLPLRGLFVSLEKQKFNDKRHRSCAYYKIKEFSQDALAQEPDLLFAFVGSITHPIREQVLKLSHPRAIVVEAKNFVFYSNSEQDAQRLKFENIMARTKFSLCPRGHGTSSFRLFETMANGRVPVIISDDWVPLDEIVNADCAIFIPEKDVSKIPQILEEAEPEYERMSRLAKKVFDENFSNETHFHNLIEKCVSLQKENLIDISPQFPAEYYRLKCTSWRNELKNQSRRVKNNVMRRVNSRTLER
jgi:hypothetical protein